MNLLHAQTLIILGVAMGLLLVLGLAALAAQVVFVRWIRPVRPDWVTPGTDHHRCRYCRLGRAYVHDERASIEGDDLVEVRCFVCLSCGLPQWSVRRSAVLKKAA